MGAKVTFDSVNYLMVVTQAPVDGVVTLDFKVDVYSDGKEDWLADDELAKDQFPIRAVGGDPVPGGKVLDPTFFILPPWHILPYDADHELRVDGNVYREDGGRIFTERPGRTITATLNLTFSAGVSIVDVAVAVWDESRALTVGKFLALK